MGTPPNNIFGTDAILRRILEGTATETGEKFFSALVINLANALQVPAAWVTEYIDEYRKWRAMAFWLDGQLLENVESVVTGTPCEVVLKGGRILHVADQVAGEFPDDPELAAWGVTSYMGIPFSDAEGNVLGHLAIFDRKPMPESEETIAIMRIFAGRAAAELRRIRYLGVKSTFDFYKISPKVKRRLDPYTLLRGQKVKKTKPFGQS